MNTERAVVVIAQFRMNYRTIFDVAKNDLGLKNKVQIIREPGPSYNGHNGYRGLYEIRIWDYSPHVIHIPVNMQTGPAEASSTIYHELKHAEQCERLGNVAFDEQYSEETYKVRHRWIKIQAEEKLVWPDPNWSRRWLETYYTNPFEKEAEEYAQAQIKERLLCSLPGGKGGANRCVTIATASS